MPLSCPLIGKVDRVIMQSTKAILSFVAISEMIVLLYPIISNSHYGA